MSNLIKNTTIYAIGDIVPRLLGFISFPILTNYLSPAEYGIVNYINTLNLFLVVFSVLCLNTYYLVFYFRESTDEDKKKMLGNLSAFIFVVNVVLSFIIYIIGPFIWQGFDDKIAFFPYIALGVAINFFSVFAILPSALFRLQEKPLPLTCLNIVRGVLTLALTLILVVQYEYKALGILISNLFINIIFAIIFIYITYQNSVICWNWRQIRYGLSFSLPLIPGTLSYYLVSMSDRILIEKYLDLNSLGIYSTASTLALLLNIVSFGAYKAFEPYFFRIYGTIDFRRKFEIVHDNFLFILLVGASGIALYSKEFFIIFSSKEFHESFYYVPMILVGVLASSMTLLYSTVITAREKTKISSIISIVGGLFSITMNILLLTKYGLISACITFAISLVLMLLASIYFSDIKIPFRRILYAFLFVIWFIGVYYINISNLIDSIGVKSIFFILVIVGCSKILKIHIDKILRWKNI